MMTGCGNDEKDTVEDIIPVINEEEPFQNDRDSMVVLMLPKTKTASLTEEQRGYVRRCNDFAFNLYRGIHADRSLHGKSNIVSPLSLGIVMGMLHDGAQGSTASEILGVLGLSDATKEGVNALFATLLSETPQIDTTVTVGLANMLAVSKDLRLSETFTDDMVKLYQADTSQLDFSAPAACASYINEWSASHTGGMISQLVSEGDIYPATAMALFNAIYFKATWARKFNAENTKEESFETPSGQRQVMMMHDKAEVLYAENDVFQMVSLPFGGGDKWSMKVLLPLNGKSVDDVVSHLSDDTWAGDTRSLKSSVVDLKLPRFKTSSDIVLNSILGDLGAPTMFTPQADFSLMSADADNLYVSLIRQTAGTEVSEAGTEMVAVTMAMMVGADMPGPDIKTFHANRPFVYIIEETSTGAVFFIGCYQGDHNGGAD